MSKIIFDAKHDEDVLEIVKYVDAMMVPQLETQYDVRRTIGGFSYEAIEEAVQMLTEGELNVELEDHKGEDHYTLVLTN